MNLEWFVGGFKKKERYETSEFMAKTSGNSMGYSLAVCLSLSESWAFLGISGYHTSDSKRIKYQYWLVVKKTILRNDGVRQWEGWHSIYEMEVIKAMIETTNQNTS